MSRSIGLCFVLLALTSACTSAPKTVESEAQAIETQVWSPYCPGRLLIDCTTQQARELRMQIAMRLERGQSSEQVLEWIRRNHGTEALARPEARGAGLAVWLVPLVLFAAGAGLIAWLIRKWSRAAEPNL